MTTDQGLSVASMQYFSIFSALWIVKVNATALTLTGQIIILKHARPIF